VLYIPTWWKYNCRRTRTFSRPVFDLDDLPETALIAEFSANLTYLPETFHLTFREGCQKPSPEEIAANKAILHEMIEGKEKLVYELSELRNKSRVSVRARDLFRSPFPLNSLSAAALGRLKGGPKCKKQQLFFLRLDNIWQFLAEGHRSKYLSGSLGQETLPRVLPPRVS